MGAACADSADLSPGTNPSQIVIHGDYFNQDTRALLIICKMAQVNTRFVLVNTMKKQNFEPSFCNLNPNSTIPVI